VAVKTTVVELIDIAATGDYYVRIDRSGNEHALSDFVMDPVATIQVNDEEAQRIFEVEIKGQKYQVSAALFSAGPQFKRWCNQRGLSWHGSAVEQNRLFNLLNNADVPILIGVTATGLYGNTFVQEKHVFGPDAGLYAYVKPWNYWPHKTEVHARDLNWELTVEFDQYDRPWSSRIEWPPASGFELPAWEVGLHNLAQLHRPDVMTPILGWMAAAPLRTLFRAFPPLAVVGGSGWGKTTLVRTVLESFGYWTQPAQGLNGSTPYGISALGSSSNALPVWVDEYRANVRPDSKLALDQLLRDAWDGAATIRGGTTENLSMVRATPATAPLVVTGEDTFSETSHIERILLINLPKDGRNESALTMVEGRYLGDPEFPSPVDGWPIFSALQEFFSAYIEWLLFLKANGLLPEVPNIHDRPEHGRAVAQYGYKLLQQFTKEIGLGGDVLPDLDLSRVKADQEEAARADLIAELIEEAVDVKDHDNRSIVWDYNGYRNIRVGAFCQWVKLNRTETLPGGQKAISKYLQEQVGARKHDYGPGGERRALRWPIQ
jgi:hypothetical protein